MTVNPAQTITVSLLLGSSDIYIKSDTSKAWNHRQITYAADIHVQNGPDCPPFLSGLYTLLVDRTVQLRKDQTFSQDHSKFSIVFPSVIPKKIQDTSAGVPVGVCADIYVIFEEEDFARSASKGTGYLGSDGWSCSPVSFTMDGETDTLMSPWTTIEITLIFYRAFEKVLQEKAATVESTSVSHQLATVRDAGVSLRQMLRSAADCVVTANDGKRFHSHRSVLSAGSPVFAAMFEHDTVEKQDATIKITDLSGNVMEEFLVFLYNRSVDVEQVKDFLEDLYHAADKYDVPDLRTICEDMMGTTLDAKNAVQRLTFAHDRGMNKLKIKAINFISANKTSV